MNRNILNLRHLTVLLMLCTAFLEAPFLPSPNKEARKSPDK